MNKVEIKKNGYIYIFGDIEKTPEKVVVEEAMFDEESDMLVILFDNDRKCVVSEPKDVVNTEEVFSIGDADYVQWFYPVENFLYQGTADKLYRKSGDSMNINLLESMGDNCINGRRYENREYEAVEIC